MELLEAYWSKRGGKPIASSSSSNKYKGCVSFSSSKTSADKKSNEQVKKSKRSAYSNGKSSSSRTVPHKSHSNGIANVATNSSSKSTSKTHDHSLVKHRNKNALRFDSFKRNDLNVEKETSSHLLRLRISNKNNPSSVTKPNKSENLLSSGVNNRIIHDLDEEEIGAGDVNDRTPIMDGAIIVDSFTESESSSTMEIDEEITLAQQNEQVPFQAIKDSRMESPKTKLVTRKPKSYNCIYEKESLYNDRRVKNIDENWDPYVEEVVAIEPQDQNPNILWIYISW